MANELKGLRVAFRTSNEGVGAGRAHRPVGCGEDAGGTPELIAPDGGTVQAFNRPRRGRHLHRAPHAAGHRPHRVRRDGGARRGRQRRHAAHGAGRGQVHAADVRGSQAGRDHLPWAVDRSRGRPRARPDAHVLAEPEDRHQERGRQLDRTEPVDRPGARERCDVPPAPTASASRRQWRPCRRARAHGFRHSASGSCGDGPPRGRRPHWRSCRRCPAIGEALGPRALPRTRPPMASTAVVPGPVGVVPSRARDRRRLATVGGLPRGVTSGGRAMGHEWPTAGRRGPIDGRTDRSGGSPAGAGSARSAARGTIRRLGRSAGAGGCAGGGAGVRADGS